LTLEPSEQLSLLLVFSGTLWSGGGPGSGDNGSNAPGESGSSGFGILAKWRELLQFAGMGTTRDPVLIDSGP